MKTDLLSLDQFRQTCKSMPLDKAADFLGIEPEFFDQQETTAVLVYADSLYIEERPEDCFLLIARDQFTGSRHDMESNLYFYWYCSEQIDHHTADGLTDLLTSWCEWAGVEPASADELLVRAMWKPVEDRTHKEHLNIMWLGWFVETFERVMDAETQAESA